MARCIKHTSHNLTRLSPSPPPQRALALSRQEHEEEKRQQQQQQEEQQQPAVDRVERWRQGFEEQVSRQRRELEADAAAGPRRSISSDAAPSRPWRSTAGGSDTAAMTRRSRSHNPADETVLPFEDPMLPFEDPVFPPEAAERRAPGAAPAPPRYTPGALGDDGREETIFLRVTVASTDTLVELVLPRSATVLELKRRIAAETGVGLQQQSFFGWSIDVLPRDDLKLSNLTQPGEGVVQLLLVESSPPSSPEPAQDDESDGDGARDHLADMMSAAGGPHAEWARADLAGTLGGLSPGSEDAALAAALAASMSPLAHRRSTGDAARDARRRDRARGHQGHGGGGMMSDVEEALIGDGEEDVVPAANDPPLLLSSGQSEGGGAGFARAFLARHPHAPLFLEGDLTEAIAEARRQQRPLVLYFHDDRSEGSRRFERMLCHTEVVSIIQMYFVAWGHDVTHSAERRRLFEATRGDIGLADGLTGDFPCLAIVGPVGSTFQMTKCLHTFASVEDMAQQLESEGVMLLANMTLQPGSDHRSVERRDLMSEQDAAYRASLEADRRKEAERKAQAEAEAEAEAQAAARAAEEEERAAAEAARAEAEAEEAAARLRDEPADDDPSAYRIRFQLPGGKSENRRFASDAPVTDLFLYMASLGFAPSEYNLCDPVSRKTLNAAEGRRQTLASVLGSVTRLKLMVEENME